MDQFCGGFILECESLLLFSRGVESRLFQPRPHLLKGFEILLLKDKCADFSGVTEEMPGYPPLNSTSTMPLESIINKLEDETIFLFNNGFPFNYRII